MLIVFITGFTMIVTVVPAVAAVVIKKKASPQQSIPAKIFVPTTKAIVPPVSAPVESPTPNPNPTSISTSTSTAPITQKTFKQLPAAATPSGKLHFTHAAFKRSSLVQIDPEQFLEKQPNGKNKFKQRIELNLFPDKQFTAFTKTTEELRGGKMLGRGTLEGKPNSSFNFIVRGNTMIGHIFTNEGVFEISEAATGVQQIREIDPSKFPRDGHKPKAAKPKKIKDPTPGNSAFGLSHKPTTPGQQSSLIVTPTQQEPMTVTPTTESPTTIDVMIAYTRAAREEMGSADAMLDLIDLAVADANLAYENSQINQRIRLVHAVEVNYNESNDFGTDLDKLQTKNDGVLDNIHTLRDQHNADMVALFIKDAADYCGISDPMDNENYDDYESHAFSVVKIGCMSNLSLVHELGHGMGAQHDPATSGGDYQGRYTYSQGYQDPGSSWRTVMAYDCARRSCVRLPIFSSATNLYGTQATGSAEQDNARTLQNTRTIVAGLRDPNRVTLPLLTIDTPQDKPSKQVTDVFSKTNHGFEVITDEVRELLPFASSSINISYTQSFVPTETSIEGVAVVLTKNSRPTVSVQVKLLDSAGNQLAIASVLPSQVTATASASLTTQWVRVNFRERISVRAGETYQLQIVSNRVNARNNYSLGVGTNSYADGRLTRGSAGTVVAARDMALKIFYRR